MAGPGCCSLLVLTYYALAVFGVLCSAPFLVEYAQYQYIHDYQRATCNLTMATVVEVPQCLCGSSYYCADVIVPLWNTSVGLTATVHMVPRGTTVEYAEGLLRSFPRFSQIDCLYNPGYNDIAYPQYTLKKDPCHFTVPLLLDTTLPEVIDFDFYLGVALLLPMSLGLIGVAIYSIKKRCTCCKQKYSPLIPMNDLDFNEAQ